MAFDKKELIAKLDAFDFPKNEVVFTFDEFFEGNECEISIGVNIDRNHQSQSFEKPLRS